MTVRGDLATVKLLDTHDAPVVLTGTSFQISRTFDLNGDPVPPGSPPSPNDLPFEIHGTSPDGGQTFTATGIDAGVNCEYVLSGRRSSGPASTTVKPATGDPCDHIAVAGFGPVRVISNCELPWAAASFVPGPPRQVLVHWSGTQWEPFDEKAFCATYTGVKPSQAVNEGQPGRIWIEYCRPKSTPTTGPVAPTTVPAAPSAAPCTRAAVQAALPPGKTVASDPHCDGDWAVSSYSKGDDTGDLGLLLQAASGRWQVVNQPTACSSGKIPASLYDEGCRSG